MIQDLIQNMTSHDIMYLPHSYNKKLIDLDRFIKPSHWVPEEENMDQD